MYKQNKYNRESASRIVGDILQLAINNPTITYCFMAGNIPFIRKQLPENLPINFMLANTGDAVEFNRKFTGIKSQFGMYMLQEMQSSTYQQKHKFCLIVPYEVWSEYSSKAEVKHYPAFRSSHAEQYD